MSVHKIYLTIDDSPSIHMDKKVMFLKNHKIPVLFYARGEYIEKHPHQIINAINNGFLIGNHSYSHPYFSEITLDQCFDEILKTETLITECYKAAKIERPCKIVRLPFGDRGAGTTVSRLPHVHLNENAKVRDIQNFLKSNDFKSVNFGVKKDTFIDAHWDWDTEDYKKKHIDNESLYLKNMNNFYTSYVRDTAVVLLHDFDNNHHLFEASMKFLMSKNIEFLSYKINEDL